MGRLLVINGHGGRCKEKFEINERYSIVTPANVASNYTVAFEDPARHLEEISRHNQVWPLMDNDGNFVAWHRYRKTEINDIRISPLKKGFEFKKFAKLLLDGKTGYENLGEPHDVVGHGALAIKVNGQIQILEGEELREHLKNTELEESHTDYLFFADKFLGKIKPLKQLRLSEVYAGVQLIEEFQKEDAELIVLTCNSASKEAKNITVKTSLLNHDFHLVNSSSAYPLYDELGDNYVYGIQELDAGYRVFATNHHGAMRIITIDKDGQNPKQEVPDGKLTHVGKQIVNSFKDILIHFSPKEEIEEKKEEEIEIIEIEVGNEKWEKEENIHANEGHFLLFSMLDAEGINLSLANFRKYENENSVACCSSLLWSGPQGSNVPITVHDASNIGFVINPNEINLPQADTFAKNSSGTVKEETEKQGVETYHMSEYEGKTIYPPLATKHACKKGYIRHEGYTGNSRTVFVTNLAKFEKRPNGEAIYHHTGKVAVFAEHIRRKYFKGKHREDSNKNCMKKNEALVFQKGDKNPIIGLFATEEINSGDKNNLRIQLQNNPSLSLYLYSKNQSEHIVRVLTNQNAITALKSSKNSFDELFKKAHPFQGYGNSSFDIPSYEEDTFEEENDGLFTEMKELPHKKNKKNKKDAASRLSDYIKERRDADCDYSPGFFTDKFIFKFQRKNQKANVALAEAISDRLNTKTLAQADLKSKGLKALRKELQVKPRKFMGRSSLDKIIDDLNKELFPKM